MNLSARAPGKLSPAFLGLWLGQLFSGLGSGMSAFALGIYAFERTGNVSAFSLMILALFLPSVLGKPLGGYLADSFDRRALMVLGDIGGSTGALLLILLLSGGEPSLPLVYLLVGVGSAFSALREPAYKASVTELVSPEAYLRAGSVLQVASSAQHLLAPLAAGFLISVSSIRSVLLIDLASFLVAAMVTVTVATGLTNLEEAPLRFSRGRRRCSGVSAALRLLREQKVVAGITLVMTLVTLLVGVVQAIFGPMVLTDSTPKVLGLIQSVGAVGMLVSSVALGALSATGNPGRLLTAGLSAAGITLFLVGVIRALPAMTVAMVGFYAAIPLINTGADVLIRRNVKNELQGRVWGVVGFLTQSGYLVAYALSGPVADKLFEPMMRQPTTAPPLAAGLVGTGPGRGIALMLAGAGVALALLNAPAAAAQKSKGER